MATMKSDEFWSTLLEVEGLSAKPMAEQPDDWDYVLRSSNFAPVSHSRNMIRYYYRYSDHHIAPSVEISLVIYHEDQPVAVWPLTLRRRESGWELGSNEGCVLPPVFIAHLGKRIIKTLMASMLAFIEGLCKKLGLTEWMGVESFNGQYGASLWHHRLMENGAKVQLSHELVVDLSMDIADIKTNLRKSYKSLLTSGLKLWSVNLLYRDSSPAFEEFRELHRQVAGRVTRHIDTWAEQEKAVLEGAAFLIFLRSNTGIMVGAGLFHVTHHEAIYAVGAYDRTLFDKPLGHLVQMRAIEEMKAMGLRWYKIGNRCYPGDTPAPDAKELSIAHFKEGFATHEFFKLHTASKVHF